MTDISHQIKTPLASLQVLDIFEQKFTQQSDDTAVIDMVHQAQKQSIRIHRLVIGLLKLTRLELHVNAAKTTGESEHSVAGMCAVCLRKLYR